MAPDEANENLRYIIARMTMFEHLSRAKILRGVELVKAYHAVKPRDEAADTLVWIEGRFNALADGVQCLAGLGLRDATLFVLIEASVQGENDPDGAADLEANLRDWFAERRRRENMNAAKFWTQKGVFHA